MTAIRTPRARVPSMMAGQLLAAATGASWFFLLIFGGLGLVLGPAGLLASLLARRAALVSVVLLVGPAALLTVSWAASPWDQMSLATIWIPIVLVVPALAAAALIWVGRRR